MPEQRVWWQTALAGVAALLGSFLGSSYQQYLNTKLADKTRFDEWRRDAYVKYLDAMELNKLSGVKLVAADAPGLSAERRDKLRQEAQRLKDEWELKAGTATLTLAVFGEAPVIHALADHWRKVEKDLPCDPGWKTNLAFFKTLRESAMFEQKRLPDSDLAELTLRCATDGEQ